MYNKWIVRTGFLVTALFIVAALGIVAQSHNVCDFSDKDTRMIWLVCTMYVLLAVLVLCPTKFKKK